MMFLGQRRCNSDSTMTTTCNIEHANEAQSTTLDKSKSCVCLEQYTMHSLAKAVALDPPAHVVSSIVCLRPDEVRTTDPQGRLPIHLACTNGASAGVISLLLEAYPDSAFVADENGCVPLHLAVESCLCSGGTSSLDTIAVLVSAAPGAVFEINEWDETPVDISAQEEARAVEEGDNATRAIAKMVCMILRRASVSQWKKMKQEAEMP
mmetsp:Transcript_11549/g.34037  ORF Transcript_11549/g.34037 Transcript_11549/m.34037 type:complete len:208 (-) Transcript_11549:97-720(-)